MGLRNYEFPMYATEHAAVDRLRPLTERIYRRLRQLVDVSTFMVGNRIDNQASYQRLRDVVSWSPPQGSRQPEWRPEERELRCAVDEMARFGLVERVQLPDGKLRLCLRFILMQQDFCAQIDERRVNVGRASEERQHQRHGETQAQQGFEAGEWHDERRDEKPKFREERHISVYLDRDEMDARARADAAGGGSPVEVGEPEGTASAGVADADFRRLLGQDGAPSSAVQLACVRVSAVQQVRVVSADEMRAAIADARSRGVRSVAGYAASIIESGSLVMPTAKVVSFAGRGQAARAGSALDGILAAAGGAMGYD